MSLRTRALSRYLWLDRRFQIGALFLSILACTALCTHLFWPYPIHVTDMAFSGEGPSWQHLFGRDMFGRDLGHGLLAGARSTLTIALTSVVLSTLFGVGAGLAAALGPRSLDQLIMRVVDVLLAFPGMLLTLALASLLGPSKFNIILAVALTGWTGMARLVRAQVLSLRHCDSVNASVALGASWWRILTRHLLPAIASPIIITATFALSGVILVEASMSFLGLTLDDGIPTWGGLLNQGRTSLLEAPHMSIAPGLMIFTTVLACNLMGDALRDALDPRRT